MDLERELRALTIEWPATPQVRLALARRRRRWPLAAAIVVAALAAALAVPQSRGAILRFFDIGADKIQFVGTLPPAQERPLDASLGNPTTLAGARAIVPALLLPRRPLPTLQQSGAVISLVFGYRGKPVLLSEVRGTGVFLKKLVGGHTDAAQVQVRGEFYGLWLSGKPHIFFFPREPARLAGNTLIWQGNDTTYRLEAPGLTMQGALNLAGLLRETP
jgi:hypothetical protein